MSLIKKLYTGSKTDIQIQTNPSLSLAEAKYLLTESGFHMYTCMVSRCVIQFTTTVQTAGVCILPDTRIQLAINPVYFTSVSPKFRAGLLIHEMAHLICDHLRRAVGYDDKKIANISMDTVINQFIPIDFLPTCAYLPQTLSKTINVEVGKHKSLDEYYKLAKDNWPKNKNNKNKNGNGSESSDGNGENGGDDEGDGDGEYQVMDDHDYWQKGITENEIVKKVIKDLINDAKAEAESSSYGNVSMPTELLELMEKIMAKKTIHWTQILKDWSGQFLLSKKKLTSGRPHRKLGLAAPGKKNDYGPNVIWATDWSGSVTDDVCIKFAAEAVAFVPIFKGNLKMMFFDTSLLSDGNGKPLIIPFGANDKYPARRLRGGTDFQPIIDYANKSNAELLIICTDGEAAKPKVGRVPIIWLIYGKDNPELTGMRILLPKN